MYVCEGGAYFVFLLPVILISKFSFQAATSSEDQSKKRKNKEDGEHSRVQTMPCIVLECELMDVHGQVLRYRSENGIMSAQWLYSSSIPGKLRVEEESYKYALASSRHRYYWCSYLGGVRM